MLTKETIGVSMELFGACKAVSGFIVISCRTREKRGRFMAGPRIERCGIASESEQ